MILKVMFCAIFTLGSRSMRMSLYRVVDLNGLLKITRLLNDAFIISYISTHMYNEQWLYRPYTVFVLYIEVQLT